MRYSLIAAAIASVVILGLASAFPWLKIPLILGLCYGLAALGIGVLLRAGQISFGHAMYACISGYTVAFLGQRYPGLDGMLLIVLGTLVSVVAGMLIGAFVVRYREIFFGMLNLAISMVLFTVLGKFYSLTGGTDGMRVERPSLMGFDLGRSAFETSLLVFVVIAALLVIWGVQRYFRSSAGEALAAIKSNETRLEYLGVSAKTILWQGYVLSAALCGLSGALFGLSQGLVTPEMGYWLRSGEFVFIAILGGSGHAVGAFVGALLYEFLKLYAAALVSGAWQLVLGATLIVIIYFLPDGLIGLLKKRRPALGGEA
ncbi:branched-chain amino acid ABC transporter permease [Pseudomonas sp.]|jgi:ABC-type branched-subunit amino acid transport system permease subunit|uniref:branched-chain amino acid ABC transporter permease n=1 Tax=Pseudomonas sp. TaxID=306 RepID=UPI001A004E44|nr:branched-chain amino acid ABC transporter permease [Pseudomonas sp.]MBF0674488.1 branched-chain amino acid ABC transporter permease [Pseudomonas sp.]